MSTTEWTTLDRIHAAAKAEFLHKGFQAASLRNIVKNAGVTTGAFYGYYNSKEELFEALVGKQYETFMDCYCTAQAEFAQLPPQEQPDHMGEISGRCMHRMLHYAYENLDAFKLLLCRAQGTRFANMADQMVEIETRATHDYLRVLEALGHPALPMDPRLEHILITGMFNAFFELIIHEMPLREAEQYLIQLQEFHTAGWMKVMGQ